MMYSEQNVLDIKSRSEFRAWLIENASKEKECWLKLKRGKPSDDTHFWYLDAVEEALCFGWIDSSFKLINGIRMQRFSPRSPKTSWTELNKARVRRLEALGLMTAAGRKVLPNMDFVIDSEIENAIKKAGLWDIFTGFPALYQKIRANNLSSARKRSSLEYEKAFENFKKNTSQKKMYGEWNDYGRLNNY